MKISKKLLFAFLMVAFGPIDGFIISLYAEQLGIAVTRLLYGGLGALCLPALLFFIKEGPKWSLEGDRKGRQIQHQQDYACSFLH